LIVFAVADAAIIALLLYFWQPDERSADAPDESADAAPLHAGEVERAPPPPPSLPPQPQASAVPPAPPAAPTGPKVVGPHPDDPHEPGMLEHPMDEAHARIDAENRLIQQLNDAMSFRKVKEMREMLIEYRRLDPEDKDASQAGYAVIADCIESPGDASLAAAHQFYDTQRHSPLRRYLRRICFENSN